FYDNKMNYISGLSGGATFTTPTNCHFIRVTVPKIEIDMYQIEEGTVKTAYEPYKVILDKNQSVIIEDAVEEIPKENLVFWAKADSLNLEDGEFISRWGDSSLNGYDLIAPNPENQPIFKANTYNGLPSVNFTRN